MGCSYREVSEKYKNDKKKLIDGYEKTPHKKNKKKKKNKRSKHKHEYIPAIYYNSYSGFNSNGKKTKYITCGSHCKYCGRVKDMTFMWFNSEDRIKKFQIENPNYIEIILPENWDYFKDKCIPI